MMRRTDPKRLRAGDPPHCSSVPIVASMAAISSSGRAGGPTISDQAVTTVALGISLALTRSVGRLAAAWGNCTRRLAAVTGDGA